jgi:hypothetical protein
MWEFWWGESVTAAALLHGESRLLLLHCYMGRVGYCFCIVTWGESVTAAALLHSRVVRKMDSGHTAYCIPHWHETGDLESGHTVYRTGMRQVI